MRNEAKIKYAELSETNKALCDKLAKDFFTLFPNIGMEGIICFIVDHVYRDYQSKIDYWKERCEAAEKVIEAMPGDQYSMKTLEKYNVIENHWKDLVKRQL